MCLAGCTHVCLFCLFFLNLICPLAKLINMQSVSWIFVFNLNLLTHKRKFPKCNLKQFQSNIQNKLLNFHQPQFTWSGGNCSFIILTLSSFANKVRKKRITASWAKFGYNLLTQEDKPLKLIRVKENWLMESVTSLKFIEDQVLYPFCLY